MRHIEGYDKPSGNVSAERIDRDHRQTSSRRAKICHLMDIPRIAGVYILDARQARRAMK
jgi:hypothetical protein